MRVVSKFSITYFIGGIFFLVVPLLVAFMICFATGTNFDYEDKFAFDKESIIKFAISTICILAISFFILGKLVRITATEDYICLDNLVIRTIKYIKYDEIEKIQKSVKGGVTGRNSWHYATSYTILYLIMKNGKTIKLYDFPYDNFEKVEKYIYENFNKK